MRLPVSTAVFGAILAAVPLSRPAYAGPAGNPFDANVSLQQQWKELGFTDGQSQKYSTAVKSKEDALRPLRGQLRDALQKLRTLVAAKASDDDVAIALGDLAQARKAVADANEKFDASLASFLSPTQRAKMLVGMPLGDSRSMDAADKRAAETPETLTDGDLDPE